eukprot:gnl/TRDRNA2_/TRDRNA2_156945_c2_seq2.p1 gnl/TRDRNA2_/TRDRNA2_156945_c2~~gnl/TRDRNA2_/TRDRNA2_156945_c2_seq2.p1  ORF type:complete len:313 (+),score=52.68 gnl/TRDRNA2_/TRDRNA2_156945_c2_seq2:61-999(+)
MSTCRVGDAITFFVEVSEKNLPQARSVQRLRPVGTQHLQGPFKGLIKSFDFGKARGFIDCARSHSLYGKDVLIRLAQWGKHEVGDAVKFYVTMNRKGFPEARKVGTLHGEKAKECGLRGPYYGIVQLLTNPKRNYGFIRCRETYHTYRQSVLLGEAQMDELQDGDEVTFFVYFQDEGWPQARKVKKLAGYEEEKKYREGPFYGKLKWFSKKENYGWISCPETFQRFGQDIFIHCRQRDELMPGDRVSFYLVTGDQGPEARNVEKIESEPDAGNSTEPVKEKKKKRKKCAACDLEDMPLLVVDEKKAKRIKSY